WRAHPVILAAPPAQTAGADLGAAQLRRPAVADSGAAASSAPLLLWQPSRPLLSCQACRGWWPPAVPAPARGRSGWAACDGTAPLITVQCGPDDKPAGTPGSAANWDSNTVLLYIAKF